MPRARSEPKQANSRKRLRGSVSPSALPGEKTRRMQPWLPWSRCRKDYEITENNKINEKNESFRLFRNPSYQISKGKFKTVKEIDPRGVHSRAVNAIIPIQEIHQGQIQTHILGDCDTAAKIQ